MKCPSCGAPDTAVKNSRLAADATSVRRRRVCAACAYRFTTFEVQHVATPYGAGGGDAHGPSTSRSLEIAALFRRMTREDAELAMRLLRRFGGDAEPTEAVWASFDAMRARRAADFPVQQA